MINSKLNPGEEPLVPFRDTPRGEAAKPPWKPRRVDERDHPAIWLDVRPPAPAGLPHEPQTLAWMLTDYHRLAWRTDNNSWMQVVCNADEPPTDRRDHEWWLWIMQNEETVRAFCFGYLAGCLEKRRQESPEFMPRFCDLVIKEAKRLPFRIGRRHENPCSEWVRRRLRLPQDFRNARHYSISTSDAYARYRKENSEWRGSPRQLKIDLKAAIEEAFPSSDVDFSTHVLYRRDDGKLVRGRGFSGLQWVTDSFGPPDRPETDELD